MFIKVFYFTYLIISLHTVSLFSASAFFGDPPDDNHPWAVHDRNRPQPIHVVAGATNSAPPSDALVLFDGTPDCLRNWRHNKDKDSRKSDWMIENGSLFCPPGTGGLSSRATFSDCQVHIEWRSQSHENKSGQSRGNSGIFLMELIEVQILDNFQNPTYADGSAGSIYGVMPPAVNALKAPGNWQSYDIIYRRPIFKNGMLLESGSLTVLCNGVVVQAGVPIEGKSTHKIRSFLQKKFPNRGSIKLQDHGDSVEFRNIWVRPLRARPIDGSLDGYIEANRTKLKRKQTAYEIRNKAEKLEGLEKSLLLYESLIYELNLSAKASANKYASEFLDYLLRIDSEQAVAQKVKIISLYNALKYLNKHSILPASCPVLERVHSIIVTNNWIDDI